MIFFDKILVPLYFSSTSKTGFEKVIKIALMCGCNELHFLYVVDNNNYGQFVTPPELDFTDSGTVDSISKEAGKNLAEIVASYQGLPRLHVCGEVVLGDLSEKIIQYVGAKRIELVVMCTSGDSRIREFHYGNNTQRIITNLSCPMLTVQPFDHSGSIKKIIVPVEESYPINKLYFASIIARLFAAEIHLVCLKEKHPSTRTKPYSVLFQIIENLDLLSIPYKIYVGSFSRNFTDAILNYSEKEQIDLILVNSIRNES